MAPPTSIPPPLPPSVEAAYRRKCIQLKQRLNEVEAHNDEISKRVMRVRRQIEKERLLRAFLLEQLAKRTSTNVEDSEGSPSPPPTPQEKPLRTKRGHRKPDFLTSDVGDGRPGSAFINQGPVTLSPSSDAFSHTHPDFPRNSTPQAQMNPHANKRHMPANGVHAGSPMGFQPNNAPRSKAKSAFDLFAEETKYNMLAENKDLAEIDTTISRNWQQADAETKAMFAARFEQIKRATEVEREVGTGGNGAGQTVFDGAASRHEADEDVEMDDASTPGPPATGGFTAVNN